MIRKIPGSHPWHIWGKNHNGMPYAMYEGKYGSKTGFQSKQDGLNKRKADVRTQKVWKLRLLFPFKNTSTPLNFSIFMWPVFSCLKFRE